MFGMILSTPANIAGVYCYSLVTYSLVTYLESYIYLSTIRGGLTDSESVTYITHLSIDTPSPLVYCLTYQPTERIQNAKMHPMRPRVHDSRWLRTISQHSRLILRFLRQRHECPLQRNLRGQELARPAPARVDGASSRLTGARVERITFPPIKTGEQNMELTSRESAIIAYALTALALDGTRLIDVTATELRDLATRAMVSTQN